MAKRKNTKALFEMLGGENGSSAKIGVPDWIKNPKPRPEDAEPESPAIEEPANAPAVESQPAAAQDVAPPKPSGPPAVEPPAAPKVERPRPRRVLKSEPIKPKPAGESVVNRLKARASRIKTQVPPMPKVNPIWLWAIAGGVLLLFVAALLMIFGGPSETPSGTGSNADKPPLKNVANLPAADEGKLAVGGEREADRNYLIIEVLSGNTDQDRQDAEQIRMFCESKNLPAQVVQLGNRFAIWSLTGFQDPTSPAAAAYAENVYRQGSGYFSQYGKYSFQPKTKSGRPFFVPGGKQK